MGGIHALKTALSIFVTCVRSGFWGMYGWYRISQLQGPYVTIFGGTLASKHSVHAKLAYEIAVACVAADMSVLTGGGPGVMEAANWGACEQACKQHKGQRTLGIGVFGIDPGYHNTYTSVVYMNTFFIRKWLFINFSSAFVFLPGGIGTADELFEVLNMIKMHQVDPVPVILVDKAYWQPLVDWCERSAVAHKLIDECWLSLFVLVNTVDEVMEALKR